MIKTTWINLQEKRKEYGSSFVRKAYSADVEVEKNEVVAVVSTDKIDAAGEIVLPKGVNLDRFRKQPGVYFEHQTDALPLGSCSWIKADDHSIIAKYKIVEDASELHKAVAALVREGAYRSHSIGFLSESPKAPSKQELRFHPEWEGAKSIHRKSLLLEFSVVGLPCNDDAVALSVGKALKLSDKTMSIITGKAQATAEATEDVITAVAAQAKPLTEYELKTRIKKELERISKNVDFDSILKTALERLGG